MVEHGSIKSGFDEEPDFMDMWEIERAQVIAERLSSAIDSTNGKGTVLFILIE